MQKAGILAMTASIAGFTEYGLGCRQSLWLPCRFYFLLFARDVHNSEVDFVQVGIRRADPHLMIVLI